MNMGAMPTGLAANQAVVAHIIVSSDQRQIDRYRTEIGRAARSSGELAAADVLVISMVRPG